MPTRAQIAAAVNAGGLTEQDVDFLWPQIKQAAYYAEALPFLPDVQADLRALVGVTDDYRGPHIAAVIPGFEQLRDVQIRLAGGKNAVYFDLAENRNLLASLVLNILYDMADLRSNAPDSSVAIGVMYKGRCCLSCNVYPCTCGAYRYCY